MEIERGAAVPPLLRPAEQSEGHGLVGREGGRDGGREGWREGEKTIQCTCTCIFLSLPYLNIFFLFHFLLASLPPCLPPSQEPRLLDAADPGPLLPELAGEAAVRQGAGQSPADHRHTDQQDGGHVEGREGGGGEEAYVHVT